MIYYVQHHGLRWNVHGFLVYTLNGTIVVSIYNINVDIMSSGQVRITDEEVRRRLVKNIRPQTSLSPCAN
jgi:hypothetical protein